MVLGCIFFWVVIFVDGGGSGGGFVWFLCGIWSDLKVFVELSQRVEHV